MDMDRSSNQLIDFLEVKIFIPSNLVNINDEVLKQKIDNISTNFAKVLDLDIIALKYKVNSEVLQLKQSLKHQHHQQLFTTLEENLINLEEDIYPTI
jgi:parvulin-like peptidyl-prolyl isomerase